MIFRMKEEKLLFRDLLFHEFKQQSTAVAAYKKTCRTMGPNILSKRAAFEWFAKFRNGEQSTKDKPRPGQPRRIDEGAVLEAIETNPTLTTRMLADDFDCSHMQIARILKKLCFRVRHGKWVPHHLTPFNKENRVQCATQLLAQSRQANFFERLVTCDEKWIPLNNWARKNQWLQPGQQPLPTPRNDWRQKRVLLCVWWWVGGIIHWETVPRGQTINNVVYRAQLDRVHAKLRANKFSTLCRRGVIFLQDNARPHTHFLTRQKIDQLGWELLTHPPYSPDLSPSDYHLFRSMQHGLAGERFQNEEVAKLFLQHWFDSKDVAFYRRGIEKLSKNWQSTIDHNGEYFES